MIKEVNNETLEIIKFYKKLSKFIFTFGIYLIFFIVSISVIFISNEILSEDLVFTESMENSRKEQNFIKKDKIIESNLLYKEISDIEFEEFSWIKINTLWWWLLYNWNNYYSKNNIISKDWYILPINAVVDNNLKIPDLNIDNDDLQIKNLEIFLSEYILKDNIEEINEKIWYSSKEPKKIPKKIDMDSAWLNCLDSIKINQFFCIKNFELFLNNMNNYQFVSKNYEQQQKNLDFLNHLYKKAGKLNYRDNFCDNLVEYEMKTKNIIDDIWLFKKCWIEYHTIHKELKTFIEIENELNTRMFTENIFPDKNINVFKLLSMQHIIYNELSKKNLEKNNIKTYLDFVKWLLDNGTKKVLLDGFYVDMIYLYNNKYLIPAIEKIKEDWKYTKDVNDLVDEILNFNDWTNSYYKLLRDVNNKKLTDYINNWVIDTVYLKDIKSWEEILFNFLTDLYNINVVSKIVRIDENQGIYGLSWTVMINSIDWQNKAKEVEFTAVFKKKWATFNITKVITNNEYRTKWLYKIIKNKWYISVNDFITYLQKNISPEDEVYNQEIKEEKWFDLCRDFQSIKIDLTKFCYNKWYQINFSCNSDNLKIKKNDVVYNFKIEDNKLKSVSVSDSEINKYVNSQLRNNNVVNWKILEFINGAVVYEIEKEEAVVNTKEIEEINIILKKYNAYLSVDASVLDIKDNVYIVSFILWDILFVSDFNSMNNKLSNLKILGPWKALPEELDSMTEDVIIYKDFEMYLVRMEQYKINQFKKYPMEYIKKLDESVYHKYMELYPPVEETQE